MVENDNIELKKLFEIIKKNIIVLLVVPIVFGIVALLINIYFLTPVYESSTTLLVNSNKASYEVINQSDVTLSKSLIYTYAEIAKSQSLKQKTIESLGIDSSNIVSISAVPIKDTQLLRITVKAKNSEYVPKIVNKLADYFTIEMKKILKMDCVDVIDIAEDIPNKVSPNIPLNIVISIMLGECLILILVLYQNLYNSKIKTQKDVEDILDVPLIGVIIKYHTGEKGEKV